ncbi:cytochrome P450 [Propioniciclava soli]|nr:cytochrome P450 [Propioniciclava soli]
MSNSTEVPLRNRAALVGRLALARGYTAWHAWGRRDPLMALFTPAGRRQRYRLYERLRAEGPVVRSSAGMASVVSHPLADGLLRSRDVSVRVGQQNPAEQILDLSLLELDPPDHTRLRALVAPAFTARRMREQEDRISAAVDALADDLAGQLAQGPVDLMAAFAKPLPVIMITALLGIPDAEVDSLNRYGDAIGRALDGVASLRHQREITEAKVELAALFERLIALRRREPGTDVISQLVQAEDGDQLTHAELIALAQLLLLAGFETTVNLLGNGVSALMDRPDLWKRLADDPDLAERAVDETLRFDPPVQLTGRTPTRDLTVDGVDFAQGQGLVILLAAANRDPEVFERPGEFDLDRPNLRDHLAFSTGIHHCVGRPLAEMEGRLALAALARRAPNLRRAAAETLGDGVVINGRATLPVRA